jgi:hypothetical protein
MKKSSIILRTLCAVAILSPFFAAPVAAVCTCECERRAAESPEEHFISKVAKSGSLVRIEDGSHWEVASGYEQTALHWRSGDSIIITPNPYYFSRYSYAIRNLTTGTLVLANLSLGPVINGDYVTRQVVDINLEQGQVLLSDGTSWLVSDKDFSTLSRWEKKDYIIVGVNNGNHYRNILINVATNRFVAAESY